MRNLQNTPPIFICGMSRAGTTWLSLTLNTHPSIAVFGETGYWGIHYVEPSIEGCYCKDEALQILDNIGGRLLLKDDSNQRAFGRNYRNLSSERVGTCINAIKDNLNATISPGDLFMLIANSLREYENKPIFIEKTPHHINWSDRITQHLNSSKFIILRRKPYEFMLSYKHQGDRKPERVRKEFNQLYHPFGCAIVARKYYKAIASTEIATEERSIVIQHDQFKNYPEETLNRICEFIGVQTLHSWDLKSGKNSSFIKEAKPELNNADIFWINLICTKEIDTNSRLSWTFDWGILKSILTIPIWGIIQLYRKGTKISGSKTKYFLRWIR